MDIDDTISRLADENYNLRMRIDEREMELNKQREKRISKEEAKLIKEVQKCKIELKKQNLTKSGYNSHNKYSYFELDDFLACVEIILDKRGLSSFFFFEDGIATLTICNEDGVCHSWNTKCTPAKVKENGYDVGVYMKSEQAVQTYARRTLWLQAMEITEPNSIESDGKGSQKKQVQKKKHVPADKLLKPQKEEGTGEITAERIQDIIAKSEKDFHEEQLKKLEKDRLPFSWENAEKIIKAYCRNDKEYQICKQSTTFKTANQV